MAINNKTKILLGILVIAVAFLGTGGILYLQIRQARESDDQLKSLREQMEVLQTEKNVAELKISDLDSKVGASLNLDKILAESRRTYDRKEQERKEGFMWVDRSSGRAVVTLGALNGISTGSRLTVYEGEKKAGVVKVGRPLDVISYVDPVDMELADFKRNYYRVIIDQ